MISALISAIGLGLTCAVVSVVFIIVFISQWFRATQRKPNKKQIDALRILLPTNAERPLELHPADLERLAVNIYQRLDYRNVKYTGIHSSTDNGVDVWMLSPEGHVEIVQCKQWKTRINKGELIDFARAIRQQHAEKGHYWAPNGFTKPATQYAERNSNIVLCND